MLRLIHATVAGSLAALYAVVGGLGSSLHYLGEPSVASPVADSGGYGGYSHHHEGHWHHHHDHVAADEPDEQHHRFRRAPIHPDHACFLLTMVGEIENSWADAGSCELPIDCSLLSGNPSPTLGFDLHKSASARGPPAYRAA